MPKSNESYLPYAPPLYPIPKLATPGFKQQSSLDSQSPPNSTSSYSMIEADITEPAYTPPSSEDRDTKKVNEKASIDDSFDSASFIGSGFGSHAESQKTHSSYAQSHDNAFWSLFGCENRQHREVSSTGKTPSPSMDGSGIEGIPKPYRPSNCDCSMPCWTEQEHLIRIARIAEKSGAWRAGPVPTADRENGWGNSISSLSSPLPRRCNWESVKSQPSGPVLGKPLGFSPKDREHLEPRRAGIEADHDVLRMRVADLEERFNDQADNMDYYLLRAAQAAKAKEKLYASNEDSTSSINPSDLDLVRSCVAGFDMSQADRSKAMNILSSLELEKTQGATSTAPAQKVIQEPVTVDTGAGRIETQIGIMSRDIIKLKAYEKFRRMQEDSDRLARIEIKLADNHVHDSNRDTSISNHKLKGFNDLQARVTKLEDIDNGDDRDSSPALLMLRLTQHFDKLERRVSSIEDDQNAGYEEISDDLSRLEKRFRKIRVLNTKHERENFSHSEKLQSGTDSDGWNRKTAAGWNSSSVGSATSSGYLRKDQATGKAPVCKNAFWDSDGEECQLACCRKSNISGGREGAWDYPASDFGGGLDYARTRRSNGWPSGLHSVSGSWVDDWARNGEQSNPASVERDWDGNPILRSETGLRGPREFSFPKANGSGAGVGGFDGW